MNGRRIVDLVRLENPYRLCMSTHLAQAFPGRDRRKGMILYEMEKLNFDLKSCPSCCLLESHFMCASDFQAWSQGRITWKTCKGSRPHSKDMNVALVGKRSNAMESQECVPAQRSRGSSLCPLRVSSVDLRTGKRSGEQSNSSIAKSAS